MRSLLVTVLGFILSFGTLNAHHDDPSEHPDPRYVSSWDDDTNRIFVSTTEFTPITFANEELKPEDVTHPLAGNSAQFLIEHGGVYLVGWDLTAANGTNANTASVQLLNVENGIPYNPNPFEVESISASTTEVLSGTVVLHLSKGSIVQLGVEASRDGLIIENRNFYLVKVAHY